MGSFEGHLADAESSTDEVGNGSLSWDSESVAAEGLENGGGVLRGTVHFLTMDVFWAQ